MAMGHDWGTLGDRKGKTDRWEVRGRGGSAGPGCLVLAGVSLLPGPPQGTAGPMTTVRTTGLGTEKSGCWGDGWTGTRRSCFGEDLRGQGLGVRATGCPRWAWPLDCWTPWWSSEPELACCRPTLGLLPEPQQISREAAPPAPLLLPSCLLFRAVPNVCVPPSRESKELADLARLHPTSCAPNGLNPNLMVTGGPALAGSGRWSADPAAHLATHPWLPRSGSTSMWLTGHPYGE